MHWIFYRFFVKFVAETFFFNKTHFSEVMWLLQWVLFPGKDYCILLLVLLALNKFIDTLIKRNLNFKCEVKSHKVCLQAHCNKLLLKWSCLYLSIPWLHGYGVTSARREMAARILSEWPKTPEITFPEGNKQFCRWKFHLSSYKEMELKMDRLTSRRLLQKICSYKFQFCTKVWASSKSKAGLSKSYDGWEKCKEKVPDPNQNVETTCNSKFKFT